MKRLISKTISLIICMLYLLSLWSCSDNALSDQKKTTSDQKKTTDDQKKTTNLGAKLSIENEVVSTTEGKHAILSLTLDKAVAKDFFVNMSFSTKGIISFINDEDYKKEIEYSIDGNDWSSESNKTKAKFANNTTTLKIRIPTINDATPEVETEKFDVTFSIDKGSTEVEFAASKKIRVLVKDNEGIKRTSERGEIMTIELSDYDNFKVASIADVNQPLYKKIVDGLWKKAFDDALKVLKLRPDIKVTKFLVMPHGGIAGFVDRNYSTKDPTDWKMDMNVAMAYERRGRQGVVPQKYNEDGRYGYTLAHEFGHLITLNDKEMAVLRKMGGTGPMKNCKTHSNREGCTKEDSHINQFHVNFYKGDPQLNPPTHVSRYARSRIEEDIAETFAHYVTQKTIPKASNSSSGALRKLNFIVGRQEIARLRTGILGILKITYPNKRSDITARTVRQEEVFSIYNVGKDGKPVSCLDSEGIRRLAKQGR